MKTITVIRNGIPIRLLEYVPEYFEIAGIANPIIDSLRQGLFTWVPTDVFCAMNVSLWVYQNDHPNAFCFFYEQNNYIALSTGLIVAYWRNANEFVNIDRAREIFNINDNNFTRIADALFFYMLNFSVAHEFGHIVHGHLKKSEGRNYISEAYENKENYGDMLHNWHTQLLEYDADSYAVWIQSMLFLQECGDDIKTKLACFDIMYLANCLCFQVFAGGSTRSFNAYCESDIANLDHPHPGIRMYYCFLLYSFNLLRLLGETDETMYIVQNGGDAVISYEKKVMGYDVKECYYFVAYTEKGSHHVKTLHNDWQDLIDSYNESAYFPIERLGKIDRLPFSLDENGCFHNILMN